MMRRDAFTDALIYREETFQDVGCHLHPACLTCPFPRCIHEGLRDHLRRERWRERTASVAQLRAQGMDHQAIATVLGMG